MKRRNFIKTSGCTLAGIASGLCGLSCGSDGGKTNSSIQPNIVVILLDDAGWNDVGYHGSEIRTPTIDRMAREGIELDSFYVDPTCSPTRASLMTGRPSSRSNILSAIGYNSEHHLPYDTITIAEMLRRNGYHTAITGKWHLGIIPEAIPNNFGFDYSYGYTGPWIDQYTHRTRTEIKTWHRNGEFIEESGHATDLITEDAVSYITRQQNTKEPFFLYVPYSIPHEPLQVENKWITPYHDIIKSESRQYFAAMMTQMDACVDRIISTLQEVGLAENTLVFFFSDNIYFVFPIF